MKQIKSQILGIAAGGLAPKKCEVYNEDNNIFLMSHNSKWNKEGLQPNKMHSWKFAAYICPAKNESESLSISEIEASYKQEIEEALSIKIDYIEAYQIKKNDAPKNDAPKNDAPKNDAPKNDAPKNDAPKNDAPKNDAAGNNKMMQMMQMMMQMMQGDPSNDEALKKIEELKAVNELQGKALSEALQRIEALEAEKGTKIEHVIKTDAGVKKIEGIVNEKFDIVAKYVANNCPVFLIGEAGSGKNVLCEQVAKALGLNFYYSNAVTQEYKLTGHSDVNGKLVETPFYKAFTEGGLFMLDEVDASDPNALIILNSCLANGYFDFPVVGNKYAHKDFRVIAAGNTKGTGATLQYSSRFVIDEATRDRFKFIEITYSEAVEKAIIKKYGADDEILSFVKDIRKASKKNNISVIAGTRLVKGLAQDAAFGISVKDAVKANFFDKYNADDLSILAGDLSTYNNKYTEALKMLAA